MTIQTGTVKWFDEKKGFGFIARTDGTQDVFAHQNEIRAAGGERRTLTEGASVQFEVKNGAKGREAANIRTV